MSTLFDAYVMVDWSAASTPKRGSHSIWIAAFERIDGVLVEKLAENPPTRAQAMTLLADLLSDFSARNLTVLAGFDFAFGYPAGCLGDDWRVVWKRVSALVKDGDDNANTRFTAAASLNAELSGAALPFWGHDGKSESETLQRTQCRDDAFPEYRLAEQGMSGRKPQSVWKLYGAGSVGSQTLTGIPRLRHLRHHPWIADVTRVWPFETGLRRLERSPEWQIILAEVWPSLIPVPQGDIKDREQMRALAHHFADLDAKGHLAHYFAGNPTLTAPQRDAVERHEGWILGAGSPPDIHSWIKDPAEIYRQSFATIRAEIDLSAVPADLHDLIVRVTHACGMTDIVHSMDWSPNSGTAGRNALRAGAPILVDAEMVARGIIARRLPQANPIICTLNDAVATDSTRSAAAVDLWLPKLDGAIVAIGNAPTALFRLLQLIESGAPRPALILGFPVGFVGAAESKQALAAANLPFVTLHGRRGGSAMAAAAVNALAGGLE